MTLAPRGVTSGGVRHRLGIAATSYLTTWRTRDTLEFLDHCRAFGAAGIHAPINGDPVAIRARAEQYEMWIEAMIDLPHQLLHQAEGAQFEAGVQRALQAGAIALRAACLPTRRYETFASLGDWQKFVARCETSVAAALPVLERYRIPLGMENHKDWTTGELVALVKRHSSEYLGVCLDFGNNIALLDDPMQAIETLAPYAVSTHLKDVAVAPDPGGFLLSEVVLGCGCLDLPRAIALIQRARAAARFSLEMITRDPLQVPCLGDRYWTTFPGRPAPDLARALRFVTEHPNGRPLPVVSHLSADEQSQAGDNNVIECLQYARENLEL